MNTLWQLRLAHSDDIMALSAFLAASTLELNDPTEHHPDDQWLVAIPVAASVAVSVAPVSEMPAVNEGVAMGCIRIRRNIGLDQPRYWYHVGCVVHAAPDLGLFHRQRTLLIGNDHTGCSELADISTHDRQLDISERRMLTRLLVRSALLVLHRDYTSHVSEANLDTTSLNQTSANKVIVGLPGLSDGLGAAPFWQGLGRHCYDGDIRLAQARFGALWLTHVAALLPRHPLVAALLNESAQAAIGCVHPEAGLLQDALIEVGLRAGEHVNLYDAGPVFEGDLTLLRGISGVYPRTLVVQADFEASGWCLLIEPGVPKARGADVQLCLVPARVNFQGELLISWESAQRLGLHSGDQVLAEEFKL